MQGKDVPDPCDAIKMFGLCEGMKWAHLPLAGGIYDQDPDLLEKFRYIMSEKNLHEMREQKKKNRTNANVKNGGMLGRPSRSV